MFICLSSGASPRYRQDVLRAMAMPKGSRLQFRYDSRWIAPGIRDRLSTGGAKSTPSLIVYIDQHDSTKVPELIPCRFAMLVDAVSHGTTVSLVLALEEFGYAEDLNAFNNEARSASAGTLPTWQPDGKIRGAYWLEIGQEPRTVVKSLKLAEWEKIVAQIAGHPDFAHESYFYTMEAMIPVGLEIPVSPQGGVYELAPSQEYELRIYHFHPANVPVGPRLRLDTSSRWLTFTTNPLLILDSRYDLKRVRLKTGRPTARETAVLTILRDGTIGEANLEFDLPLQIRGTFWSTLGYGTLLGILLAAPQVVAAFSNPTLPLRNATVISIVSGILGLGAGIVAAFGLKKSI